MTFRTGLVVGKFCPLHRGHQLLIDTARAACDRLLVISYAKPGFPGHERPIREQWLAQLYPDVVRLVIDDDWLAERAAAGLHCRWSRVPHDHDDPEDDHRRFCAWLCHDVLGETVEAVFTSEDYGDGFAEVLGHCFSEWTGRPHRVRHVCVDQARRLVPVSGTAIRQEPWEWAEYLDPRVRASFVRKVAVLGAESTGKTTLCAALADSLGTAWVPEYGRDLWIEKDGALNYADMLAIGREQVAREERALADARRWLICDTSPMTTRFYSDALFGDVDPKLIELAARRYDHILLCAPDFGFVQDGTRQDPGFQARQQDWYRRQLDELGLPFTVISGSQDERMAQAAIALAGSISPT